MSTDSERSQVALAAELDHAKQEVRVKDTGPLNTWFQLEELEEELDQAKQDVEINDIA